MHSTHLPKKAQTLYHVAGFLQLRPAVAAPTQKHHHHDLTYTIIKSFWLEESQLIA